MSDTVFAQLPRFDTGQAGRVVTGAFNPAEPEAPALEVEAGEDPQDQLEAMHDQAALRLAAIEETLTGLAAAKSEMEEALHRQAARSLQSVAETLFPKLSPLFLAEEIARHLPDLLPLSSACVEIRAEEGLAAELREVVARSERLASLCTVIDDEAPGANRVSISWTDGGVDVDFDTLLEVCLERLRPASSNVEG